MTSRRSSLPTAVPAGKPADDLVHHRGEDVSVKVVLDPLHNHRYSLEPSARVDPRLLQGPVDALPVEEELGENEVPELEVAVAVAAGGAVGASAPPRLAGVVIDLRTGAADPGLPDRSPEVVLPAEPDDPFRRHAGIRVPYRECLVVVLEDADVEPVFGKLKMVDDELPRPGDRLLLEIVTETEIPEHLEKGVVAKGPTDAIEIAGPEALLDADRAPVGEVARVEVEILELDHPRRGEKKGRIPPRDERGARHLGMPPFQEEIDVSPAYLVRCPYPAVH